jgi:hypothetical protein
MRTFILDIIPKIKKYSVKLDKITALTNTHWVVIDDALNKKIVFIFREKNNQLLISDNGRIEKGTWEYLGYNSLLIDKSDGSYLFKHGFIDDHVLALKIDGKEEYALLVNEEQFDENLNSLPAVLNFLNQTYIEQKRKKSIIFPKRDRISEGSVQIEKKDSYSKPKEVFLPHNFPGLDEDLKLIREKLKDHNEDYLAEIVISFARDHSIKGIWANENPALVEMVVNKKIPIGKLEQLFNRSKDNLEFRKDFEKYLFEALKNK